LTKGSFGNKVFEIRGAFSFSMKLTCLLAAGFLASATLLLADDEHFALLKVGEEVYTNVTVTSATATDIYFTHSRGIGNAKLKNLEPELQQHFHYNAAKAAAKQSQQAQGNALYRQALLAAPPAHQPQVGAAPQPEMEEEANGISPHPIYARSFLNRPAPELIVEKWLTGEPDRNGKFVLLDFWATWCGPCRRSIPELNAIHSRFSDRLVVIGLSNETEEEVRRMKEPGIDYTVAIDTKHRTESEVGVRGIPHTMLIDPKGVVRFEGMPGYLSERDLGMLLARYSR
jgi:thiol-disulfide isomerase/thioredoxin